MQGNKLRPVEVQKPNVSIFISHFRYSCACKKIKILMSPNNSIVLENDRCDHLNLIVAALISNTDLKTEFHELIQLVHCSIDLPEPLDDCLLVTEVLNSRNLVICYIHDFSVRISSDSLRKYSTNAWKCRIAMS